MKIVEVFLFAAALLVVGLVVLALLWSGTGPYEDLMKGPPGTVNCIRMINNSGGETCYDIPRVVELHRAWSSYETGGTDQPPTFADVRNTLASASYASLSTHYDLETRFGPIRAV